MLAILLAACSSNQKKTNNETSLDIFQEYVSGVSTGAIKRSDAIIVKFTNNIIGDNQKGTELASNILKFDPKIEGTAKWVNADAIEFIPTELLEWNTRYTATLQLGQLTQVSPELKKLKFTFQTPDKQFTVSTSGLSISPAGDGTYETKGEIHTSDIFVSDEIEKILTAQQDGKKLAITWEHHPKSYSHLFTIANIQRKTNESKLHIIWDGGTIGAKNNSGESEINIPAINNFKVSQSRVVAQPDQYVEVLFSDPINTTNDIRGFIQIDNSVATRYTILNNVLRIYPPSRMTGIHTLKLNGAIESTLGYKLGDEVTSALNFGGIKPQVKLLGNGVIVPQSKGLFFPFEAVSLNAVDVRITKIFTNNIIQFFQNNDYNYHYNIEQVGRIIHRSKVDLSNKGATDLNSWNAFNLDLSKLIEVEPGAIYNVEIGFRKNYSLFNCESNSEETDQFVSIEDEELYPEQDYRSVFWRFHYSWKMQDDACSPSYYSPDRFVQRNILGSNYGIIAKVDPNNKTYIYITNLLTAEPEPAVPVELYDYQNQLIQTGSTNGDGMLMITAEREPFLLVARKDNMVGYLKIDNSTIQSTSNFDVDGNRVQKGLKGFIYGERGVWRPGDSIFVSFILEDKMKNLPPGHPLILEIYNSKGQFVKKIVKVRNEKYIYPFYFKTNPDDPTGNWQLNLKVGAVRFSKTIRIETVKPNRLKVEINFGDKLLSAQRSTKGTLESKWLHGAPAKELKAKVDVTFTPYAPKFKAYKNFDFSTPYNNYNNEQTTIFDNVLDEQGKAEVNFKFKPNNEVNGFLKATFTTKVFEKGGDFSINSFSRPFSPYIDYVGLKIDWSYKNWNKLNNDEEHTIEVATVDENGNPLSLSNVEVKLYELDYRWWYNSNRENLASYAGKTYHKPVFSTKINSTNGKGTFRIGKNEDRWGRHLLLVSSPNGHVTGQIIYFGWAWGREQKKGDAQMLALVTEQDHFKVGEEVTVSFPANKEAKALITFENGSGIIGQEWLKNLSNFTHYTFKATPEMAPNIYVHVTLIQPHAQTANDLPIRLFGVTPIMVEDPDTRLQPQLKMPEEVRPLQEFSIQVSEANKKAMDYTLAIVDDGLLDITNFKTPEPWESFFAREALGVKTYDLYNYVMGSFGSRLESMFAVGGGDQLSDNSKKKSERFKPVVKVLGPFHLNANSKASHKVTLPQYVGSVRTMVIAAENGCYGQTENTMPVREPLMVLATLPRVLSPGETVDLPVTIFAMKENVKKVKVTITCNDLLQLQSKADTIVTFDAIGEKDIFFKVKSANKTGIAKVKVEVSSGSEHSFHEIELDIRQPNLPTQASQFKLLEPNEKWNTTLSTLGMEGTNKAQIEVASMPPLNLGTRLNYLIRYPHGCIEQTTSSVFPQLYLPALIDLSTEELDKIKYYVATGIEKLQRFQMSDGGFSYWPGGSYSSDWATCYAGHFLIEAERAGYLVPGNMKAEWMKYMRNQTSEYSSKKRYQYDQFSQAYRLYLLAMEGEAQISSMNRLRTVPNMNNQTKWLLAGAYALAGMKDAAYQVIDFRNMVPDKAFEENYGSYLRDECIILQTLLTLNELEQAAGIALDVSKKLSDNQWYSTQTTAYALVTLARFGKVSGSAKGMKYKLGINGKSTSKNSTQYIETSPITFDKNNNAQLEIQNNGTGVLFVNVTNEGVKPGVDTSSEEKGLQLMVNYYDQQGNKINPAIIKQGLDFSAKVTVYNTQASRVKNVALSQLFPAGWEIINSRLFNTSVAKTSSFEYQDIRDDRVYTYFDIAGYETKTFIVNLNASYTGEYLLSPVSCGAMYDHSYYAKVAGMKVKVLKE